MKIELIHTLSPDLRAVVCHLGLTFNTKMEAVMANIAEVLAAVGKIEGDVGNVQRVLGIVNEQNAALIQQVADLQAVIEGGGGVTAEQLQEVADRLGVADAALDTLAPDAPDEPNVPE